MTEKTIDIHSSTLHFKDSSNLMYFLSVVQTKISSVGIDTDILYMYQSRL